jgi:tetratricopeptide (TPR) repeat protein
MRSRTCLLAAAAIALAVLGGCSKKETADDLMKSGLDALYGKRDANAAAAQFRRVLDLSPNHYGATYQLATALDRAGRRSEATPYWEKMLAMSEASRDEPTASAARTRLGRVPPAKPEDATMQSGLDALYKNGDPQGAVVQFRKVLEANPNHYGATFQLAKALDLAGKPAEARPVWEKALKLAEGYKDVPTADAARARLARQP